MINQSQRMIENPRWDSIEEVFKAIEEDKCEYVLLRSYDEIFNDENYFNEGHDLDLLCPRSAKEHLIAVMRLSCENDNNFVLKVKDRNIPVDITCPGSGEFDAKWEKDMLSNRIWFREDCCHVLSQEDYFYTLLFHSLIHKGEIQERYKEKIIRLGRMAGLELIYEPDNSQKSKEYYGRILYKFMKKNRYNTGLSHFEFYEIGGVA